MGACLRLTCDEREGKPDRAKQNAKAEPQAAARTPTLRYEGRTDTADDPN
jgi:hypothetical protein